MKGQTKTLLIFIAVPLAVGVVSALLTQGGMAAYGELNKPSLSPPAWVFPVVWTVLYVLMGIASYLAATSKKPNGSALIFYFLQLVFNFFWSIIFFGAGAYLFAFVWLVIMWVLIAITAIKFLQISQAAGVLMLPYLAWVTFAGYLNFSTFLLN